MFFFLAIEISELTAVSCKAHGTTLCIPFAVL
jgi:hypothetical protein